MELGFWFAFVLAAVVTASSWAIVSVVEWLWLSPRRLERALRAQGLSGSRYRFPNGDLSDDAKLIREALGKPMPLSHGIVPRVAPELVRALELYGDERKMAFTWFGPRPRVILMDPELIREVLSTKFGHFEKPKGPPFGRLLASGVAGCEGEKWAKHRRIINPAFHVEKLKRMMPAFSACCEELINRWEDLCNSTRMCEIDVLPEFRNFAGDVISRAAFSSSYKEGRRIFELQLEQTDLVVQAAQNLYIPGFRFIPTKRNRRINEIYREVIALLKSMVDQREHAMKNGEAGTNDLLGLLMESNRKHSQEKGDRSQDVGLTTEEVIEECKLFYFAGHETTSVFLTWTMILLAMHPNWQDKARKEVLQVFGQNKPNFEGLNRLKIASL